MTTVTISPKYQVVIPKTVRESLKVKPGQKMQVVQYENRIEFIIDREVKALRGILRGVDTSFERDGDRL